ncbi:substrate-binding domain-containing protein [Acanthopleuribacter pedis]|uniref:Substrate-binding domain-containing protein n=1 Tax=Acanthopleuribacter pedis TaxID=442870 RepID=A0A8J7U4Q5_9BACT|nr:substrate-binding domain-containing protein [Acanthopleuribacter pedis]MBO1320039.1 substrate-binding domain-containing protein [Acanthopleuribacter pedis]
MVARVALFSLILALSPGFADDFVVIVNASNSVESISLKELSKLFLKKKKAWEGGGPVVPVEQAESAPLRASFSEQVHRRPVSVLRKYWLKQAFSGTSVKPPEKASDAEIIAFVAKEGGGIGYVSADTALPASVKKVAVQD